MSDHEHNQHPTDNALISEKGAKLTPGTQGSAGGNLNRDVGSRAEQDRLIDPEAYERDYGADDPKMDALKGQKTLDAIQQARNSN